MRIWVLLPEVVVLGAAVLLVLGPRVAGRDEPRQWPRLALVAALLALGLELWLGAGIGTLFDGGWRQDRFSLFGKAALLLGLVTLLAAADWDEERSSETLPLAFLAVFGGMVAASSATLVGLWAGLELAAAAGVAAAATSARSNGVRLLVASAVAAGLVLFGLAYVYALAGTADLVSIQSSLLKTAPALPVAFALAVLLAGLAVRLVLAPFWALGGEGALSASGPGAAVLGGLVPAVAVVVGARLLSALVGVNPAWATWLAVVAAATVVLGGLRSLAVSSPRALTAWLAAAQAGWVSAGLATHDQRGSAAALFLTGGMVVAATAAHALAAGAQEVEGGAAGLGRRDPFRAAGLSLALLSLAAVPPLAGAFGEFTVAAGVLRAGLGWLLGVTLLGWILGVAAVVRALRSFYLESGHIEQRRGARTNLITWGAAVPAVLLLAYGLFAYPISDLAGQAATALGLR
jgi:NADH-quinone oxidoreductase subunit N